MGVTTSSETYNPVYKGRVLDEDLIFANKHVKEMINCVETQTQRLKDDGFEIPKENVAVRPRNLMVNSDCELLTTEMKKRYPGFNFLCKYTSSTEEVSRGPDPHYKTTYYNLLTIESPNHVRQ